jgi:hypothetical protein
MHVDEERVKQGNLLATAPKQQLCNTSWSSSTTGMTAQQHHARSNHQHVSSDRSRHHSAAAAAAAKLVRSYTGCICRPAVKFSRRSRACHTGKAVAAHGMARTGKRCIPSGRRDRAAAAAALGLFLLVFTPVCGTGPVHVMWLHVSPYYVYLNN